VMSYDYSHSSGSDDLSLSQLHIALIAVGCGLFLCVAVAGGVWWNRRRPKVPLAKRAPRAPARPPVFAPPPQNKL
jgi:uncharacterized iron-regulated membrane protein